MEQSLAAFSNGIAALAEGAAPYVVAVNGRRRSHSSGVHWRQDLIVTAEHTLRRDEEITVTDRGGKPAEAALVGRDPGTDIALLRCSLPGVPAAPVETGSSPRVGEIALVVGRSPNSGHNASMGIISAVSGEWRTWRGGTLDAYIRLGAEVFAGSSGGAVIDHRGAVTGIATSALSRVAGLSIPASTVNRIVERILALGNAPHAYIGVGLQPVPMPSAFREKFAPAQTRALMVLDVESGGPADRSGILVGDMVFEIEGKSASSLDDVQSVIGWEKPGKSVALRIIRGGALKSITLTTGVRPARSAS